MAALSLRQSAGSVLNLLTTHLTLICVFEPLRGEKQ